jgi:hypothetical protein
VCGPPWKPAAPGGQQILEIDYDTYAAAEDGAGLAERPVALSAEEAFDPAELAVAWLAALRHGAVRTVSEIGQPQAAGGDRRRARRTVQRDLGGGAMGREGECRRPPTAFA